MKSNQLIIIAVVIVLGAWAIKVYAGTVQMNTYYPAPNGNYDSLSVKTKFFYPCYDNTRTEWINKTTLGPPYTIFTSGDPNLLPYCNAIWPYV